jgi:hypothetical protein
MTKTIEVVAKEKGYFSDVIREPGERFLVPEDLAASWFSPAQAQADDGDRKDDAEARLPIYGEPRRGAGRPKKSAEA